VFILSYRKPFDVIFQRAKNEEWRAGEELNLRPLVPETISGNLANLLNGRQQSLQPSQVQPVR
jgi:hypothetical protein